MVYRQLINVPLNKEQFFNISAQDQQQNVQKYENVKQFSPIQKKYVKSDISPEKYLF